jgi:hypothetical protein
MHFRVRPKFFFYMIHLSLMTTFPQLQTKFVLAFVNKTGFLGTLYSVSKTPKANFGALINHSFRTTSNLPGLVVSCPARSISYTKGHYLWGRKPECPEKIPIIELTNQIRGSNTHCIGTVQGQDFSRSAIPNIFGI